MNVRNRAVAAVACAAAAVVVTGCSRKTETPPAAASTVAAGQAADTIYVGGDIVTVNDAQPGAEALAIKDGKILAIGTRTDLEGAHKGDATKVVDLQGKAL